VGDFAVLRVEGPLKTAAIAVGNPPEMFRSCCLVPIKGDELDKWEANDFAGVLDRSLDY
jgi:hypothetical protein